MEEYDRAARLRSLLSPSSLSSRGKKRSTFSVPRTSVNSTARATLGLEALYAAVTSSAGVKRARPWENDGGRPRDAAATAVHGAPPLSSIARVSAYCGMPLMGQRYRCVSTIGEGTFAEVVRAEDTFRRGKSVAIKIMNLRCEAIGRREVGCMRFLNCIPQAEFCPVVKLLDTFTYLGHYCLVMELLDGSLLPYTLRAMPGLELRHHSDASAPKEGRGGSVPRSLCRERGRDEGRGLSWRGTFETGPTTSKQVVAESSGWAGNVGLSGTPRCANTRAAGCNEGEGTGSSGVPTHVIRHVALQMVSALLLLHDRGLVHADIKPENVLLGVDYGQDAADFGQSNTTPFNVEDLMRGGAQVGAGRPHSGCSAARLTVKLCDFGNTIQSGEARLYYDDFEIQTLAYRAPEVLMGCPFGPAVDTWSFGVVLLELVLGRSLFHTAGSRAALLRQTLCAFGPLPLRRFREGRFFSEYFTDDNTLKSDLLNNTADRSSFGCCSCCWMGDNLFKGDGNSGPVADRSCSGECALNCRHLDVHRGLVGTQESAENPRDMLEAGRAAVPNSANMTGRSQVPSNSETPIWRVAYAHLCRLISAADPGPIRYRGRYNTGGRNSIARRNPRLLSFLAGLLCLNPDERLTPLEALAHPFFAEVVPFAFPLGVVGIQSETPTSTPSGLVRRTPASAARRAWAGSAVPIPRGLPDQASNAERPRSGPRYLTGAATRPAATHAAYRPVQGGSTVGTDEHWQPANTTFGRTRTPAPSVTLNTGTDTTHPLASPSPAPSANHCGPETASAVGVSVASASTSRPFLRQHLPGLSELQPSDSRGNEAGGQDDRGNGSGSYISANDAPLPTRFNRFLKTVNIAGLKPALKRENYEGTHLSPADASGAVEQASAPYNHRVELHSSPKSTRDAFLCEPSQVQANTEERPLPSMSCLLADTAALHDQRQRNRFLTPAVLAKLNHVLEQRHRETTAVPIKREGRTAVDGGSMKMRSARMTEAATETVPKRSLVAARVHDYLSTPGTENLREQTRYTSLGLSSQSAEEGDEGRRSRRSVGKAKRSSADLAIEKDAFVAGTGRATTPRRAAVAAVAAVRRLLEEDTESADDSM